MLKFTVYLMKPVLTWENVEAENEEDAIAQCNSGPDVDICSDGEPMQFIAIEQEES